MIGCTQNGAKHIDLFDCALYACDLDMVLELKRPKKIIKNPAPMFEKVSLNAMPIARLTAPSAATNIDVSTPKFAIAAIITKAIRSVLVIFSRKFERVSSSLEEMTNFYIRFEILTATHLPISKIAIEPKIFKE